jgi:hypothetical protein
LVKGQPGVEVVFNVQNHAGEIKLVHRNASACCLANDCALFSKPVIAVYAVHQFRSNSVKITSNRRRLLHGIGFSIRVFPSIFIHYPHTNFRWTGSARTSNSEADQPVVGRVETG